MPDKIKNTLNQFRNGTPERIASLRQLEALFGAAPNILAGPFGEAFLIEIAQGDLKFAVMVYPPGGVKKKEDMLATYDALLEWGAKGHVMVSYQPEDATIPGILATFMAAMYAVGTSWRAAKNFMAAGNAPIFLISKSASVREAVKRFGNKIIALYTQDQIEGLELITQMHNIMNDPSLTTSQKEIDLENLMRANRPSGTIVCYAGQIGEM